MAFLDLGFKRGRMRISVVTGTVIFERGGECNRNEYAMPLRGTGDGMTPASLNSRGHCEATFVLALPSNECVCVVFSPSVTGALEKLLFDCCL